MKGKLVVLLLGLSLSQFSLAERQAKWGKWVEQLKEQAISEGIEPQLLNKVFSTIRKPSRRVRNYSRSQPEHRLTFNKYRKTRASKYRIAMGKREYKKYRPLLEEVGKEYGVDPCFIVSIWGMETSYGRFMGSFPVLKSLATLAYDSKRQSFFRQELINALHIVNGGHVSLADFKGEWAGATGQSQFLPSSWIRYAVDYDRDGKKDIWRTKSDVFASIANYLKEKGWAEGKPWAIKIHVPRTFDGALEGKKIKKPVSEWSAMGVTLPDGKPLPYQDLESSVVMPYGGPALLAFRNFRVIMRYNNSTYYAGSIGYMADKICGRKSYAR